MRDLYGMLGGTTRAPMPQVAKHRATGLGGAYPSPEARGRSPATSVVTDDGGQGRAASSPPGLPPQSLPPRVLQTPETSLARLGFLEKEVTTHHGSVERNYALGSVELIGAHRNVNKTDQLPDAEERSSPKASAPPFEPLR